jgi:hypothetical protein
MAMQEDPGVLDRDTQRTLAASDLLMMATETSDHELTMDAFNTEASKKSKHRRLSYVKTMKDVFAQYDTNHDDHLDHSEQMTMYNDMNSALESTLHGLVKGGLYDAAAALRDRIVFLHDSFAQIQREAENKRQQAEQSAFRKAAKIITQKTNQDWGARAARQEAEHADSRIDLHITHSVNTMKLEEEMAHLPPKLFKSSSSLLAMRSSERSLCTGRRFEEAKVVKVRADRKETAERDIFDKKVEAAKNSRRKALSDGQADKTADHESLMKRNEWTLHRHGELDKWRTNHRMQQNQMNMHHTHALDAMVQPVFTYKPLLPARQNHKHTSASNRGTQMLSKVATGRAAVAGLCARHDFNNKGLDGTITFTGSGASSLLKASRGSTNSFARPSTSGW